MLIRYLLVSLLILPQQVTLANPQENVEGVFSTALLLGDADAISFGIANFDPVEVFKLPNIHIDTAESLQLRNQLSAYNLPYSIKLTDNNNYQDKLQIAVSYIQQKQTFSSNNSGENKDDIYSLSMTYQRSWLHTENWISTALLGNYLMTYQNKHSYNSEMAQFKERLDGLYYNLRSNAFLFKPGLELAYHKDQHWGKWLYRSRFSAFYGWTFAGDDAVRGANPSGWEWVNGVKGYFDIHSDQYAAEAFYIKAARIDIGGDVRPTFNTSEYYEVGLGFLLSSQYFNDWIDNVGIGLNVNFGSSLTGGSLVLYVNE